MPEIICTSFTQVGTEVGEVTPTDISVKHQKELERLKTALTEKDLENQRLLLAVEEAETVHKPLIQAYAAKISEKVSDFMKFIQDRSGDSSNDELEQMKIEIQELTACLEKATGQIGRRETKTTFVDTKHHFVQRWLNASPSSPPPSDIDSGLITEATSIRSVDSESSDIVDPIRHIYNEFPQQT